MLKQHLEQRHIDLDNGRSCLALEPKYCQAREVLAYEDSWNKWRVFYSRNILPIKPEDIPLESHVQKKVTLGFWRPFV